MQIVTKLVIPVGCCSEVIEWETDKYYCFISGTYPHKHRMNLTDTFNGQCIYYIIINELLKYRGIIKQ